ncbi:WD40 repeat-like protein [Rozella allomycis CSF55]|uniref:WD40 repeat-like protein n=1 Tax=Rozella allomycis (strain CSF55) TaxID=988480 RepID=A0A4P9YHM3_ROZAC|nr:WD40 repeat-like protein [Rozella allomycis CSF55]
MSNNLQIPDSLFAPTLSTPSSPFPSFREERRSSKPTLGNLTSNNLKQAINTLRATARFAPKVNTVESGPIIYDGFQKLFATRRGVIPIRMVAMHFKGRVCRIDKKELDDEEKTQEDGKHAMQKNETGGYPVFTILDEDHQLLIYDSSKEIHDGLLDSCDVRKVRDEMERFYFMPRLNVYVGIEGTGLLQIWRICRSGIKGGSVSVNFEQNIKAGNDDEWIKSLYVDGFNRIYVLFDYKICVYDMDGGYKIKEMKDVYFRPITSIFYHRDHYLILGFKDGLIKVYNTSFVSIHHFQGHTKAISGICSYPYEGHILTSSLDGSVRLWSLITFTELYKLSLNEPINGIRIVNEKMFYLQFQHGIKVMLFNHFHNEFGNLTSKIIRLEYVKDYKKPGRLFCCMEDGSVCLMSPIDCNLITSAFAIAEPNEIEDVVYSYRQERIYVLMKKKSLIVINCRVNPCTIIDYWNDGVLMKEDITSVGVYDKYKNYEKVESSSLLIGGTRNGQLVGYDTEGNITMRLQIHPGAVTFIAVDNKNDLIYSIGQELVIRVSEIKKNINFKYCISCETIPKLIKTISNYLIIGFKDGIVHIVENDEKKIITGNKADHSDLIKSVSGRIKLGLFVTSGLDGHVKIWSKSNAVIREFKFNVPIYAATLINEQADLLVCLKNRIELIKATSYLPEFYLSKLGPKKIRIREESLNEDKMNEKKTEKIKVLNNGVLKAKVNDNTENVLHVKESENHFFTFNIENAKLELSNTCLANVNVSYLNNAIDLNEQDLIQKFNKKIDRYNVKIKRINEELVPIAPDGYLPNSSFYEHEMNQNIKSCNRKNREDNKIIESADYKVKLTRLLSAIRGNRHPQQNEEEDEEEEKQTDSSFPVHELRPNVLSFRAKQGLLRKVQLAKLRIKATQQVLNDDSSIIKERRKSPNIPVINISDSAPPNFIQKAIESHLVKEEEIYAIDGAELHKRMKIEPTTDALIPFLINSFNQGDLLTKSEVLKFVDYIQKQFGFNDKHYLIDLFISFLCKNSFSIKDQFEIVLKKNIFLFLDSLNCQNPEYFYALFLSSISSCQELNELSRNLLIKNSLNQSILNSKFYIEKMTIISHKAEIDDLTSKNQKIVRINPQNINYIKEIMAPNVFNTFKDFITQIQSELFIENEKMKSIKIEPSNITLKTEAPNITLKTETPNINSISHQDSNVNLLTEKVEKLATENLISNLSNSSSIHLQRSTSNLHQNTPAMAHSLSTLPRRNSSILQSATNLLQTQPPPIQSQAQSTSKPSIINLFNDYFNLLELKEQQRLKDLEERQQREQEELRIKLENEKLEKIKIERELAAKQIQDLLLKEEEERKEKERLERIKLEALERKREREKEKERIKLKIKENEQKLKRERLEKERLEKEKLEQENAKLKSPEPSKVLFNLNERLESLEKDGYSDMENIIRTILSSKRRLLPVDKVHLENYLFNNASSNYNPLNAVFTPKEAAQMKKEKEILNSLLDHDVKCINYNQKSINNNRRPKTDYIPKQSQASLPKYKSTSLIKSAKINRRQTIEPESEIDLAETIKFTSSKKLFILDQTDPDYNDKSFINIKTSLNSL